MTQFKLIFNNIKETSII